MMIRNGTGLSKSVPGFKYKKGPRFADHSHQLLVLALGYTQMHTHYSEWGGIGLTQISKEMYFV